MKLLFIWMVFRRIGLKALNDHFMRSQAKMNGAFVTEDIPWPSLVDDDHADDPSQTIVKIEKIESLEKPQVDFGSDNNNIKHDVYPV